MHQGYLETHSCLVSVAADGRATIWSSSQGQFMVRAMTSYLTGIPQSNIRAIPAEIGGGFGGKTIVYSLSHWLQFYHKKQVVQLKLL